MGGKRLLLVDGNSLANRAFYALPPLSTNEGQPTGAVFGFLTMLFRFIAEKKPTHVAVAFDHPSPTFRHAEFTEYKATRKPAPQEFKVQIPLLKEVLDALRLQHIELPGYEADDIIGTLARKWEDRDLPVTVLSGDKDCLQLVDEDVEAILPVRGITQVREYKPDTVRMDMGIVPSQVRDFKALAGDSSDNIPGVKGVGEKTAVSLLQKYKDLDDIYEHLAEITPAKVQKLLAANKEAAFLSRRLATIDTKAPLPESDADLVWTGPDLEKARALLTRLQFHTLVPRLASLAGGGEGIASSAGQVPGTLPFGETPEGLARQAETGAETPQEGSVEATPGSATGDISAATETQLGAPVAVPAGEQATGLRQRPGETRVIASERDLAAFAQEVLRAGRLGIYSGVEEITKDFLWPEAIGVSAGNGPCLIRLEGNREANQEVLWRHLQPVLVSPQVSKVGFDLKWVLTLCFKRGITPAAPSFDVVVAAYLLDPTRTTYRLDDLVRKYTGAEIPEMPSTKDRAARSAGETGDLAKGGAEAEGMREGLRKEAETVVSGAAGGGLFAGADAAGQHFAAGADACFAVAEGCRRDLEDAGLTRLAEDVEFPLIEVLAAMEAVGMRVDLELGRSIRQGFADALITIEESIYNIAGEKFNLGSPKQLAHLLFEKLNLTPIKKTKTGYSTDAEVLETLSAEHELPAKILDYRQYAKLKSTYLDVLEDVINPATGRIHSTFHQTVTATGRLSSSEPNLQNIPVRGELGRSIRRIFIPADGRLFLAADYSQIELRIVAHMADDPGMIDAFARGEDIHARTASEIFGVPMDKVDGDLRSKAKAVNFGIIYGISDYGLARNTGVSRAEARSFIEMYFARYPKVKEYMDAAIEKARKDGYVATILGRRRAIPDIDSRIRAKRGFAERTAINTPIQGSAADIIKLAMVRIYRRLREDGLLSRLILQVHDELVFEIPPSEEEQMQVLVRREMEGAMQLKVPVKVDIDVGKSWYDV
jgi:DNA polymerase-1